MKRKSVSGFLAGMLCGAVVFGGGAAYAASVIASPSTHHITVDGVPVSVEAYNIDGNNYFQLRDLARLVGFNVTWDNTTRTVEIDTDAGYLELEQPATTTTPGDATDTDLDRIREEIVEQTNALRRENGLPALTMDDDLMAAAQVRAEEAAANLAYRHVRPDGSSFKSVLQYNGSMDAGENLGMKDDNLTGVPENLAEIQVNSWCNSSGHFQNMTNDAYTAAGTGIAQDRFGMYYVVLLMAGGNYVITGIDQPILP